MPSEWFYQQWDPAGFKPCPWMDMTCCVPDNEADVVLLFLSGSLKGPVYRQHFVIGCQSCCQCSLPCDLVTACSSDGWPKWALVKPISESANPLFLTGLARSTWHTLYTRRVHSVDRTVDSLLAQREILNWRQMTIAYQDPLWINGMFLGVFYIWE